MSTLRAEKRDVAQRGCGEEKKTPLTVVQVDAQAEIKMFHIEQSEMNWARPEEREEKNQWVSGCGERDGITNGICQWGTAAAK